jgi:rRNA maturation RNase YbeY
MNNLVSFFYEDVDPFITEEHELNLSNWLLDIANQFEFTVVAVNVIFCIDTYIRNVNVQYLNHDYETDIITFDNSEFEQEIESDIYISIESVKENASIFNISIEEELLRVLAHGLLHLVGFNDKSDDEVLAMREQENKAINRYVPRETFEVSY